MTIDMMKRHCLLRINAQRNLVRNASTPTTARSLAYDLRFMADLFLELELIPQAVRDSAIADADAAGKK